ncbi:MULTISPECIES: ABC transporter permease [Rhizobium/Agrobacterium group]|uniref:ABC transporter permease n=1 Tax=Agrobacterium tumefaciens TaxID=358 RepID=A0AAE6EGI9_AGRTU|nr:MULTISPECIES: ABC transporter permease [Rhizobium/Agrobacterium group]MCZ7449078.1 ABC transporter permease [Rhizobium rhizogenes]QCL75309.1 ABC transporter permease [Agrobacterium tumefaciens]QCL80870.1 ABC transporter permease [Agrobacterium tumefaciens]CUX60555.1 Ribose transport system permease protein RbsC [Agrobacterium sp. NCPPB 925]
MTTNAANVELDAKSGRKPHRRIPPEANIFFVLIGIALVYEILGWIFIGQSFLMNQQRLTIMILQVSVIGIIAVGVTQVIITGGIDLSSGSVVGLTAMLSASVGQSSTWPRALYPGLTDLPFFIPLAVGVLAGALAGFINGQLIARTKIPPFIATLGMMVTARGLSKWYTKGQPISGLTDGFNFIGTGIWPVVVFLVVAVIFHVALRYTRYGKFTYAIGANQQAARVSGINIEAHLIKVYAIAGLLAGLAGVVTAARAQTAQAGMGVMYELDAIAAAVIGGTSLAGGAGRITGTVIGTIILGVMTSGFTFLRVDAYYQEIVKGLIIVAAVVADVYRQKKRAKR